MADSEPLSAAVRPMMQFWHGGGLLAEAASDKIVTIMPAEDQRSPRITALSWGRVETDGGQCFKDAKLYPGGARAWDWRETGMHHVPGIRPAEVEELVERGATTVVLSKGVWERLEVAPDTLQWLKDKGVAVEVLQTDRAVARYNELCESGPVGALIHSTC